MEIKKSAKASLENKRLLFTEIGFVIALLVVYGAFEYSSKEKAASILDGDNQIPLPRRPRPRRSPSSRTRLTLWTMKSKSTTICS